MKDQTTRRAFKSRMDAKQDVWRAIPALMGDGNGTIEVPGQPGYVYIRVGDGDLGQAFNNRCPLADEQAIYVGYDPITDPDRRIFQVLSVRMADYAAGGNSNIYPNVAPHHTLHELGGGDDVYVNWRRLMGFRVGRPAAFTVTIDSGVILRAGAWVVLATQTINLAALKPAGLQERYILITLNAAGVATATAGVAAVGANVTSTPVPGASEIPLASVRLYGTQTAIGDTPTAPDIFDLRFPQAAASGTIHLEDLDGYARGRIIRGGAVDWEAYSLAGAAGSFLRRDANDVLWSTLTLPNAATTGDILYASGANAIGNLADVAVGQALVSGGVGAAPAWSATPTLTGLTLSGLTASTVIYSNAAKAITSLANAAGVLTNDGAGGLSWGAGGGAHDILSATHTDSVANAVTRGSLIYGNSTPAWDELALGGAAGSFVTRNATDVLWSGFYFSGTAGGTTNFAVTNTKTLTLTSADSFNITFDKSGTAAIRTSGNTWTALQEFSLTGARVYPVAVYDAENVVNDQWGIKFTQLAYRDDASAIATIEATCIDTGVGKGNLLFYVNGGLPVPALFEVARFDDTGKFSIESLTASTVIYSNATKEITSLANAAGYLYNDGAGALSYVASPIPAAHAIDGALHTVAGRTAGQVLIATAAATFGWSGFLLSGTVGGTTNLAVTNTKTLTLTATDSYNFTIPATGTAALLGVANAFTDSNTIASGKFLT